MTLDSYSQMFWLDLDIQHLRRRAFGKLYLQVNLREVLRPVVLVSLRAIVSADRLVDFHRRSLLL